MMKTTIAIVLATVLCAVGASAQPSEVGTWRLSSIVFVDEAGGRSNRFGEKPDGYAIFTPGGYLSVVINAQDRRPLSPDQAKRREEQPRLLSTMTAHAGRYRMQDGRMVHPVDVAHDPAMVGKDLIRSTRLLSADVMESTTPPVQLPDGRKGYSVVTWRRVE